MAYIAPEACNMEYIALSVPLIRPRNMLQILHKLFLEGDPGGADRKLTQQVLTQYIIYFTNGL